MSGGTQMPKIRGFYTQDFGMYFDVPSTPGDNQSETDRVWLWGPLPIRFYQYEHDDGAIHTQPLDPAEATVMAACDMVFPALASRLHDLLQSHGVHVTSRHYGLEHRQYDLVEGEVDTK